MSCKNLLKQMLLILEIQMVKMTAKNRLKIVKIFYQRNKKKKIMKIYKFSQKKYFLKNLLQEGINRFKDTWYKGNKIVNILENKKLNSKI